MMEHSSEIRDVVSPSGVALPTDPTSIHRMEVSTL